PSDDDTIPDTAEAEREYVRELFTAMYNTEGALEKTNSSRFKYRWSSGAESTFYKPWDVEKCCWRILKRAIELHTVGFNWPIFDLALQKKIRSSRDYTFKERMRIIIDLLKISKKTCETVLKMEKMDSFVGAPKCYYDRVRMNVKNNDKKEQAL
ncbi:hypothetical protein K469DRAFT_487645, partial [Zopfia rhizophila CBS 207.26]